MTAARDPTDAVLVEQAVAICHTGRDVGRRIGARDARVSLIRASKAHLTAKQRGKLVALLASPPVDLPPAGPTPSTTPDGKLLDAARALPQVGTYAALAVLLGVSPEHLSRVRMGLKGLSKRRRTQTLVAAERLLAGLCIDCPVDAARPSLSGTSRCEECAIAVSARLRRLQRERTARMLIRLRRMLPGATDRQIEIYAAIERTGTVRRAAEEIGMTQSAVYHALRVLWTKGRKRERARAALKRVMRAGSD